jgi:hypothetical protein
MTSFFIWGCPNCTRSRSTKPFEQVPKQRVFRDGESEKRDSHLRLQCSPSKARVRRNSSMWD